MSNFKISSKNFKAKNVRNFNCLYDVRHESDRLKEMKKKIRIGGGDSYERKSVNFDDHSQGNKFDD